MATGHFLRRIAVVTAAALFVVALGPSAAVVTGAPPDRPVAPQATPTPTGTPTGPAPAFELSVETNGERISANESLLVNVTVRNVGDEIGTKGVEFVVDDELVDQRNVTVAPGTSRTVQFEHQFTYNGNHTIDVDYAIRRTVVVEGGSEPPPDPEPDFELAVETSADRIAAGNTLTTTVTVRNVGRERGTKGVEFEAGGLLVDQRNVTVAPGGSRTVRFEHQFTEVGNQTIQIDHVIERTVVVTPLRPNVTVSVDDSTISTADPVRLRANVTNDGRIDLTHRLELRLFGEVVDVRTVTLAPGESETVAFTRRISQPGTYTASLAGRTFRIEVVAAGSPTPTPTQTTTPRTGAAPGFGILAAVAALAALAAALLVGGRR